LVDAHRHPISIEVAHLEMDSLADSQATRVDRLEDETMFLVLDRGQESRDVLAAQDLREPLRLLGPRHLEFHRGQS
jgi:hypothetical protein